MVNINALGIIFPNTYDELVPIAAEQGLLVAYDGMTVAI